MVIWISYTNSQYTTFILIQIVDISATAAAFIEMTVHQVSLWRTVVLTKVAPIAEHQQSK